MPKEIHFWCAGLHERGGIQHYTVCLLGALSEVYPDHSVRIFAKNDHVQIQSIGPRTSHLGFGWLPARIRTAVFAGVGLLYAVVFRPEFVLTVHPHFMKALAFLSGWVPLLSAAHGIEVWGKLGGHFGASLRKASLLLPVSEFTAEVLRSEGQVPHEKVAVIPNTFRDDQFVTKEKSAALLEKYGLSAKQPIILTVGRLFAAERYKGHDQVITAMAKLKGRLSGLHYVIAGTGDDLERLQALVRKFQLEQQVTFAGYVPESDLADHYRMADLYVMPSTGEGFGIVYLESLACGRPCLVGNQDASPEAIDGGRLGLVVNPRDPDAIGETILAFFNRTQPNEHLYDPEYLSTEVRRIFGIKAFKERLQDVLRRVRDTGTIQN